MAVVNEISLNIKEIVDKLLPEQKQAALIKVGTLVQNESKLRCGVKTGILRNSISYVADENQVSIGTNVEYAPFHHKNNPFLQSGIDENLDKIENCFTELLN